MKPGTLPPAQNADPAPVSTTERASRSREIWYQTSRIAMCSGSMNALRMSGLFMVRIRTGPSASTSSSSGMSYIDVVLPSSVAGVSMAHT